MGFLFWFFSQGYLNENGNLNLKNFEKYLEKLSEVRCCFLNVCLKPCLCCTTGAGAHTSASDCAQSGAFALRVRVLTVAAALFNVTTTL